MDKFFSSVFKTLAYHDIFDFPLTQKEIHYWLVDYPQSYNNFQRQFSQLSQTSLFSKYIDFSNRFYYLKNRSASIKIRQSRKPIGRKKNIHLNQAVARLKTIPAIETILLTGSLAMNNACLQDDIDLAIITRSSTLWTTRLLATLFLSIVNLRRKPYQLFAQNKICINLWLDENRLKFSPSRHDIFTAHELLHAKPLYDKNGTYSRLLKKNSWVSNFFPNAYQFQLTQSQRSFPKKQHKIINSTLVFLNPVCFLAQKLYMLPKITTEEIGIHKAFFHPQSARQPTLAAYFKLIKDVL